MKAWEEVAGSGDTGLVTTSNNGRTPFVPDEYGNATVFGTTDNASATPPFDQRIDERIHNGVLNGTFARSPAMPDALVEDINPIPDWTGPVQVSGGGVTVLWTATTTYGASGAVAKMTLNPGAAGDDAYIQQIVYIGGSQPKYLGHFVRVGFSNQLLVAGSIDVELEYLDAALAALGSTVTTNSGSLAVVGIVGAVLSVAGTPDEKALYLRVRIHLKRDAALATDTGSVWLTDVKVTPSPFALMLPEGNSTFTVPSAFPTPPSGFHSIYAKASDSKLYSKSDGGTEYKLNNVIGTDVQAWDADLDTIASTYVGATAWTPTLSYATVGTSTWAPSVQDGSYMRIGPLVWVWFRYVGVPTNGTGAGALTLSGLPVAAKTNANSPWTLNGYMGGWTKATYTAVAVQVTSAAQTALFAAYGSGVAPANLAVADIPTGGSVTMKFEGFYESA